jgi:Ca-activated chloride channel family protein
MTNYRATFLIFSLCLVCFGFGQDGASTAGLARTRAMSLAGQIPPSRDVVVEDFINYPRHELPLPKAGNAVALDVRWREDRVSAMGEAVLQVGISTSRANDLTELRPLNLAIVIDKSGSMADDGKLEKVKAALTKIVAQLRSTDILSIVEFGSNARVLLSGRPAIDHKTIDSAIRDLHPGGATNLNGGLMLGYQEALKNYRPDATNRVILLTDGIANRGVTDPDQIASSSASYNDRGIDLCTIGLGSDVNQAFLAKLAKGGRGLFHFIASSEDIDKVFVQDLQSQLSPVAAEPNLTITFGPELELEKVYGYEPKFSGHSVRLNLTTMNRGLTQAVLLRFKANGSEPPIVNLPVSVKLTYFDLDRKQDVDLQQTAALELSNDDTESASIDPSVAKNFAIASVAEAIRDMAADCEAKRFIHAQRVLDVTIGDVSRQYPTLSDPDVARTLAIATRYQHILRRRTPEADTADIGQFASNRLAGNVVENGNFALGNSHFVTGLGDYVPPTVNCLWAAAYTIAPTFDRPTLHTLVEPGEFSAPRHPYGNGQVLFANAGGTDAKVIWSSIVKFRPNTRYQITFDAISLSGSNWANGREIPTEDWVPTFQISLGGAQSAPQRAGCGSYSTISMTWDSNGANTAVISIERLPMNHNGGIIGIANIKMISVP